jgi:cytochrome c553
MRSKAVRSLGWVLAAAMPLAAHGASLAQQEYASFLRSKPDLVHGRMLFDTCAACHGTDGAGASDGTVPALAAQPFRVVAENLVDFRHNKRWDERMEHFADKHHLSGAQDIADVAAYIASLKATRSPGHGSGEYLQQGAQLYTRMCASCHGSEAEGDNSKGYPRLAGQQYAYLLRQLNDTADGQRPNFTRAHNRLLMNIRRSNFVAVADYLSRLGP